MKTCLGLILVILLFTSCAKEENLIPDLPVNYNVTLVEFSIKSINNVLLVPNKGVGGLIIFRTPNGFVAFDRCSTVNPEKICSVIPDESGFTVTDPCSGAKFSLLDGSPQKAPARTSLKAYRITENGGLLQVTN